MTSSPYFLNLSLNGGPSFAEGGPRFPGKINSRRQPRAGAERVSTEDLGYSKKGGVMKNKEIVMMVLGLILCAGMLVWAEDKTSEERNLESSAQEMDKEAAKPACQESFQEKIKSEFKVDDARVQGLRDQKMGYGEISIALGLAQGLPGGITDENVRKIVALRQGPPVMGWGRIAKDLGLKLGPVRSKMKKISAEARKEAKAAERMKKGGKGGKPERPGKMDRPEKSGKI